MFAKGNINKSCKEDGKVVGNAVQNKNLLRERHFVVISSPVIFVIGQGGRDVFKEACGIRKEDGEEYSGKIFLI